MQPRILGGYDKPRGQSKYSKKLSTIPPIDLDESLCIHPLPMRNIAATQPHIVTTTMAKGRPQHTARENVDGFPQYTASGSGGPAKIACNVPKSAGAMTHGPSAVCASTIAAINQIATMHHTRSRRVVDFGDVGNHLRVTAAKTATANPIAVPTRRPATPPKIVPTNGRTDPAADPSDAPTITPRWIHSIAPKGVLGLPMTGYDSLRVSDRAERAFVITVIVNTIGDSESKSAHEHHEHVRAQ